MLPNIVIAVLIILMGANTALANTTNSFKAPVAEHTNSSSIQNQVDINVADVNTLMTLHGIGKVKAQAIVTYRQQHGAFKTLADLANVKGFSEAAILKLVKNNPERILVKAHSQS